MVNKFETYGTIVFDPKDKTNKHKNQSNWKKIAMVDIKGDMSEYYAWFIKKRYNLTLNPPLRRAHITFINDSHKDLKNSLSNWEEVKKKWDGKEIKIVLYTSPRTDGKHWWINIPEKNRTLLHRIRKELSLNRPHWGLHLTIGYANEKNIEHSQYIHDLIQKGFIN